MLTSTERATKVCISIKLTDLIIHQARLPEESGTQIEEVRNACS